MFDVREPDEYEESHIPGAILVPLATVPDEVARFATAASNSTIYLVCGSGGRSGRAVSFLRDEGIDAINVDGGTKGWIAANYPVE